MAAYNVQLYRSNGSSWDPVYPKTDWTNIVNKPTSYNPASHIHDVSDVSGLYDMVDGKAPQYHANSGTTYGVGTTSLYGHVKIAENLTTSLATNGLVLGAYQGYLLKQQVDSKASYEVKSSVDFNTMTTPGIYTMRSSNSSSYNAPPSGGSYHSLIVLKSDSGNYIQQIAIKEDSRRMYIRYGSGGSWGAWTRVLTKEDFAVSGSTLTINLSDS